MGANATQIFREALGLSPAERAALADELLSSLTAPDLRIDELWAREAEARISAFEAGSMKAVDAEEVFAELEDL